MNKPDYPINSQYKIIAGILTLIFGVIFAFVYAEERQRGLALLTAFPLAICLIWYAFLAYNDEGKIKKYKEYRQYLIDNQYGSITIDDSYGIPKQIVGFLTALSLVMVIVFIVTKVRYSVYIAILSIALLALYGLLDYLEREELNESINNMERDIKCQKKKESFPLSD